MAFIKFISLGAVQRVHVLTLIFAFILTACGGGSGAKPDSAATLNAPITDGNQATNDTTPLTSNSSVYDASLIPAKVPLRTNILDNGSFELDDRWVTCSADIITGDAAAGSRFLRLDSSRDCSANQDSIAVIKGLAYHPINLASTPESIYISFKARTSKPIARFDSPFSVFVMGNEDVYSVLSRRVAQFTTVSHVSLSSDWSRIKVTLDRDDIVYGLGDLTPGWILFLMDGGNDFIIDIDDVRVSLSEDVFTQAVPMPEQLATGDVDDKLLFINWDETIVASANANGSNFVTYPQISAANLAMAPIWAGLDQIALGRVQFYPAATAGAVISAEGTDLMLTTLSNGQEAILYQSIGRSGRFEFSGSPGNLEALDVTIRNGAWDASIGRGAFGVCGRSRLVFVSDDVCSIYIINSSGVLLNSDTEGYNPAWSSSGQIAFVSGANVYVGDVDTNGVITAQVVHTGVNPRVVAWSPDGAQLAFIDQGGAVIEFNDSIEFSSSLRIIDLTTNLARVVVSLDQGVALPSLAWLGDGDFLAYTIRLISGELQVWWAEIATGNTGPITNTIDAGGVSSLKNP